jgi:hypothetical protein
MVEEFRFHIAMTVRDGQVVVTGYPTGVKQPMLDHITGKTTPDDPMGDASAVRNLNRKYGFESFMQSGWVDIRAIARVLTEQSDPTELGNEVMEIMEIETTSLNETCNQEISTFLDQVPRFVAGTETFSQQKLAVTAGVEIESEISQQLGELGAPIPAYGSKMFNNAWMSMGMGINVEKYVDFGMEQASQVVNDPYQCKHLEPMNQAARRMTQVSGSVPPALRQVKAASVVLSELELSERGMRPTTMKGMALVRARNPSSILAWMRAFVPGLAELSIEADGVPVSLQKVVERTPTVDAAHLAYTEEYLGASIGMGTQDVLAEFLESPSAGSDSPLLSFGMDLGRVTGIITDRLETMLGDSSDASDDSQEMNPREALGMSFLELDADADGLFVSYRMNTPAGEGESGGESSSSE